MSQTRWLSISNIISIVVFLSSGLVYTVYGIRYVENLKAHIGRNTLEIAHVKEMQKQQTTHISEAIDDLKDQYKDIDKKLDRLIEQHIHE